MNSDNQDTVPSRSDSQFKADVQRGTRRSHRSSSDVRHGQLFENPRETLRLVTPDPHVSALNQPWEADNFAGSPQALPRQSQGSTSGRETSASLSNTDEETATVRSRRKGLGKSKDGEGMQSDLSASPSSLMSKTRRRLHSITTSPVPGLVVDGSNSIGYLSVDGLAPFTNLSDIRNSLPRGPYRTSSSDTATGLGTASAMRSPLLLTPDSNKILTLMKTTCGRMHGILFFRPIGTSAWESGYCAINVAPGSLVCQKQGELSSAKTLLPDLRGCSVRTNYDAETQSVFISVVLASSGNGYQLRPPVPETFDSWLAALLCWQPLRPKGVHNKLTKTRSVSLTAKRLEGARQLSEATVSKSTATVKVGRMLVWDGPLPAGSQRHLSRRNADFDSLSETGPWRRVGCTLHENGTFKLLTEVDNQVITSVRLSGLARCAVQRLDKSVLGAPYCLAIYRQYTRESVVSRLVRPLILGLESQNAYDAWYVLLRTLTTPELYGPEKALPLDPDRSTEAQNTLSSNVFRIERSLTVKITEAKLHRDFISDIEPSTRTKSAQKHPGYIDVYADVILGRDVRARTFSKNCTTSAFWAEEFLLSDLPTVLSTVTVAVKMGNPAEQEWSMVSHDDLDQTLSDTTQLSNLNGVEVAPHDPDFGKVEVYVEDLEQQKTIEKWWQMLDNQGRIVGSALIRFSLSECVVLMESEYTDMSTLLHAFDNGLTNQIALTLSQELKNVSELLLNVFQASNTAHDWIILLVEDEIDGLNREVLPMHMRFNNRVHSNDSYESAEQREALVRDLSRSATMEANLLFRGNSLVTRALDAYMRRLGQQYLEQTLGDKLRQILIQNLDCEVNPSRIKYHDQLAKNWSALRSLTNSVWRLIAASASRCPAALRMIFKHIRSCAEDRYGSFIRTVKYTSVSGFLFLRFFCPAILNPKLFGLIDDHPPDRARRTFTLIAKSLNVLASMAKFGTKETWMEPMNQFLQAATPEFKVFIEEICFISSSGTSTTPTTVTASASSTVLEPQFIAPMQMRARLSPASREGLPMLPHLLDPQQSLATLVQIWIKHAPSNISEPETDQAIQTFHRICLELHKKTEECLNRAEAAEKPDRNLEPRWQQLLNQQQRSGGLSTNPFEDSFRGLPVEPDITALPQPADLGTVYPLPPRGTNPIFSISGANDGRRLASAPPNLAYSNSANSSTISFEHTDESRKYVQSREGSTKGRLFEYLNPARKRNKGDRLTAESDRYEMR